ncbi:MAG TPA: DUF1127 domain-containing protein [Acetobacteraceae bacterium]|nr:DUF1127 domain-containing protein [Acetobacteraceae bacterium]
MTALFPRQTAHAFAETRVSRAWDAGRGRPARFGAVGRFVAAIGVGIREHLRRQQVMNELSQLTDRELADIGITRNDIGQIFTPEFVAQRRFERGA